ncbi:hypothetical protein ACJJID_07545 [Microbulbifer sp. CnH-101-G]|uniref:hypothetical protein n=1 Tax=Microbulbifer sp. CnH-101-G TaxID=3243393 RepID=UPI0040394371
MASLSLKTQNSAPLALLVLLQLLAVHCLNSASFDINLLTSIQKAGGVMLAVGALAGWLSYLLPVSLKNTLVFLRLRDVLPGHRFIQLSEADPRIDTQLLKEKVPGYEPLSSDHKGQNSYWYREFYRPVADQHEVTSTHKSYLLYRDAATVSLLCAAIFVLAKLLLTESMSAFELGSGAVFPLAALGFALAAGNAGRRLVTTTVAISMAKAAVASDQVTASS